MSFYVGYLPSLTTYRDDEKEKEKEDTIKYKNVVMFILEGVLSKYNLEYNVTEIGKGNTFTDALNNMQDKLITRFDKQYGIILTDKDKFTIKDFYQVKDDSPSFCSDSVLLYPIRFESIVNMEK